MMGVCAGGGAGRGLPGVVFSEGMRVAGWFSLLNVVHGWVLWPACCRSEAGGTNVVLLLPDFRFPMMMWWWSLLLTGEIM